MGVLVVGVAVVVSYALGVGSTVVSNITGLCVVEAVVLPTVGVLVVGVGLVVDAVDVLVVEPAVVVSDINGALVVGTAVVESGITVVTSSVVEAIVDASGVDVDAVYVFVVVFAVPRVWTDSQ